MTSIEFNEKYDEYLEKGNYGLDFEHDTAIKRLDEIMQDLIKIPDFKYQQIKMKWGKTRFYADGVSMELCRAIEIYLDTIIELNIK